MSKCPGGSLFPTAYLHWTVWTWASKLPRLHVFFHVSHPVDVLGIVVWAVQAVFHLSYQPFMKHAGQWCWHFLVYTSALRFHRHGSIWTPMSKCSSLHFLSHLSPPLYILSIEVRGFANCFGCSLFNPPLTSWTILTSMSKFAGAHHFFPPSCHWTLGTFVSALFELYLVFQLSPPIYIVDINVQILRAALAVDIFIFHCWCHRTFRTLLSSLW